MDSTNTCEHLCLPSWVTPCTKMYPEILAGMIMAIFSLLQSCYLGRHATVGEKHCVTTLIMAVKETRRSWIRRNPLLIAHIPQDNLSNKMCKIPHIMETQRASNKVIKPHQSPTYPGVEGEGQTLLWLVRKTIDGIFVWRNQEQQGWVGLLIKDCKSNR